jgi:hypothetical protein
MVSTFKAVHAQGYHQIMGRFSTRLATSFLNYVGYVPGQAILDVFLSGKPDGFRSFLASAWICKGIVAEAG